MYQIPMAVLKAAHGVYKGCMTAGSGSKSHSLEGKEADGSFGKGDYFVPWHVPFHRADAVTALRASSRGEGSANSLANGAVDRQKSSIVFKRYYHLFDEGELGGLVAAAPSLQVDTVFYDKSNWCCSFVKS